MYKKDPKTGIVSNTNEKELQSFMSMRERIKREKQLVNELDTVKTELCEIRRLIANLTKSNSNDSISC